MTADGQRGKSKELGVVACVRIMATCARELLARPVRIPRPFHGVTGNRVLLVGFLLVTRLADVCRAIPEQRIKCGSVRIVAHETFGRRSVDNGLCLKELFLVIMTGKTELLAEILAFNQL